MGDEKKTWLTRLLRFAGVLLGGLLLLVGSVPAVDADTIADAILGGLHEPSAVGMDPSTGRLYVLDQRAARVLSWPNTHRIASGEPPDLVLGQPDFTTPSHDCVDLQHFCDALGLAVGPDGTVYVADTARERVVGFSAPHHIGQLPDLMLNQLNEPRGVAVDATGHLYVADTNNGRILRFSPPIVSGQAADLIIGGTPGSAMGQPWGLSISPTGDLFVAAFASNRVLHFPAPLRTGEGSNFALRQPDLATGGVSGVALNRNGDVFVVDPNNSRVLRYAAPVTGGTEPTEGFGQPDLTTAGCNTGGESASSLCFPLGAMVDGRGDLWVADSENNRVLRYNEGAQPPTCTVTSLVPGPPAELRIAVHADRGLSSVAVASATNTTVAIPTFTRGAIDILVTATKIDQTARSTFTLRVTDLTDSSTTCDPVIVTVGREPGEIPVQVIRHAAGNESHATITNGAPGVDRLRVVVNGHQFHLKGLHDGETRALDVSSAMREGTDNTIIVVGHGPKASSAVVMLADS